MTTSYDRALVYLSGPITAKHGYSIEENVAAAVKVYLALIVRGVAAFCPHLAGAFPSAFDVTYDAWLQYDLAIISRCTHVLMLPRWETSNGAKIELAHAIGSGVPVYYETEDLIDALANEEAARYHGASSATETSEGSEGRQVDSAAGGRA